MEDLNELEEVYSTTQAAIARGRIGHPVFLRWLAHLTSEGGRLRQALREGLKLAVAWLDERPVRVFALGGLEDGHVAVMVEFARGQRALVAASASSASPCRLEWLLIGSRGSLVFEGEMPGGELGDTLDVHVEPVWDALARCLESGGPADVAEEPVR